MRTRTQSRRTYGGSTRSRPQQSRQELPQSPIQRQPEEESLLDEDDSIIKKLTAELDSIDIDEDEFSHNSLQPGTDSSVSEAVTSVSRDHSEVIIVSDDEQPENDDDKEPNAQNNDQPNSSTKKCQKGSNVPRIQIQEAAPAPKAGTQNDLEQPAEADDELRVITWHDICPPGDQITKIAEASFSEVYRIKNDRGTSIIKCIRMPSPLKPQTKTQIRAGLVDEEPHQQMEAIGELQISEWLADIPGFVVYKERYIAEGKAPKAMLETHQAFHRRMKREDPDRLQFYPSPSRYLDGTRFLVVELGDAGVALEDFQLKRAAQLWDIFFLVALALARAEDLAAFEHRDLHEGNICIRQVSEVSPEEAQASPASDQSTRFGTSGLDITILDYGLSRAEEPVPSEEDEEDAYHHHPTTEPLTVAPDLEQDLSLFTSTHAPHCEVYRRMRSHLLSGGTSRKCLPPSSHRTPYQPIKLPRAAIKAAQAAGTAELLPTGPLSWVVSAPYTNVLWLAYLYRFLVDHFRGDKKVAARWEEDTAELWRHLDPDAKRGTPVFSCAADVVRFAVEAGWMSMEQIMAAGAGHESSIVAEREESSILLSVEQDDEDEVGGEMGVRRSPRRRTRAAAE